MQTNSPYGGDVRSFAMSGMNLFAGTHYGGVFLSTNNGTSWTSVDSGLTNRNINTLIVSPNISGTGSTNLFAGTSGSGVWRRSLPEMVTSVEKLSTNVPTHYKLEQNYPNPFNPATTFSFSVPSKSYVSLKIFDLLGRQVATVLSEEVPAGSYSRIWNAANMSSGVYFYRMQAGPFSDTKKLLLLK